MKIQLPGEVSHIIKQLENAGFEAFAVGGCIRDICLGRTPKDWDITSDALPEQIKDIFPVTIDTGIEHGTVTVRYHHKSFEVTTYRTDGTYSDGRRPDSVTFVRDLKEDLRRRDFTINALAYNDSSGLVDEFGGMEDLSRGIIRCVEDPVRRFKEDALRMMRAIRFVAQLGFTLDPDTKDAICKLSSTLARISEERICDELIKLICSDNPKAMRLLYETGLTGSFFPEWDIMMETEQHTIHHRADVGDHCIFVMEGVPPRKPLRLAAMLHDIAKPVCRKQDSDGNDHFAGHPQLGARMAEDFMRRLKMDNDTIRYVKRLILFHDERPRLEKRALRRAVNRIGEDLFPDLFTLRRADIYGQSEYRRQEKLDLVDGFEAFYEEFVRDGDCLSLGDMAVTGKDLLGVGLEPGPAVGQVLKRLLAMVLEDPRLNQKEILLDRAQDIIKQGLGF